MSNGGKMNQKALLRMATVGALVSTTGIGIIGSVAGASTTVKGHDVTIPLDFSSNPNTTLEPPPFLAPLDLSACPFDATATFLVTGNVEEHSTENSNGGWGGGTITGTAVFTTATAVYSGHFTGWTGGGSNQSPTDTTGQSEAGLQLTFQGTSGSSALDLKIGWHYTANNAGNLTAFNESVSCTS